MERSIFNNNDTFLSVPGSSTTLNTLDRICARILERHPFASNVCITRFFSSLSSYIFEILSNIYNMHLFNNEI